jgi:DNA-binding transcriptional regulator YhcF (GntR family)
MKWKFRGDRPIYAQLIEQLERGILTGEYPPGSSVPSVRTLAIEAEVNPNTMQRALAELETRGLLHTHRTAGRTVTEDRKMIDNLKEELAKAQINEFFEGMQSIGIERESAAKLIAKAAKDDAGMMPNHNSGDDIAPRSETRNDAKLPAKSGAAGTSMGASTEAGTSDEAAKMAASAEIETNSQGSNKEVM